MFFYMKFVSLSDAISEIYNIKIEKIAKIRKMICVKKNYKFINK